MVASPLPPWPSPSLLYRHKHTRACLPTVDEVVGVGPHGHPAPGTREREQRTALVCTQPASQHHSQQPGQLAGGQAGRDRGGRSRAGGQKEAHHPHDLPSWPHLLRHEGPIPAAHHGGVGLGVVAERLDRHHVHALSLQPATSPPPHRQHSRLAYWPVLLSTYRAALTMVLKVEGSLSATQPSLHLVSDTV